MLLGQGVTDSILFPRDVLEANVMASAEPNVVQTAVGKLVGRPVEFVCAGLPAAGHHIDHELGIAADSQHCTAVFGTMGGLECEQPAVERHELSKVVRHSRPGADDAVTGLYLNSAAVESVPIRRRPTGVLGSAGAVKMEGVDFHVTSLAKITCIYKRTLVICSHCFFRQWIVAVA